MNRILMSILGWRLLSPDGDDTSGAKTQDEDEDEEEEDEDAQEEEEKEEAEEDEDAQEEEEEEAPKKASRNRRPASIGALRAALPNASSDELLAYAGAEMTVKQAKAAHKVSVRKAIVKRPGGKGVKGRKSAETQAGDRRVYQKSGFEIQAEKIAKERGLTLVEAKSELAASNPQLYTEHRDKFVGAGTGRQFTMVSNRAVN